MHIWNLFFTFTLLFLNSACTESIHSDTTSPTPLETILTSGDSNQVSDHISIGSSRNNVVWHWENKFEKAEVYKIKMWLKIIDTAIVKTFGVYPFDIHFYIHRSKSGNEPTPWAHTTRGKDQGVHFHVNPSFTLAEFLADWTAQHEISHLSIPFVGKENAWFSEGYATYMQCQVMLVQKAMTADEVKKKYKIKFAKCKIAYQSNLPFPQAADSLKSVWNYPAMYWGGASFFWKLNQSYESELHQSLAQVLTQYVSCCRVNNSSPQNICLALDKITHTKMASDLLLQYQTEPAYTLFEKM
ncbi:MAG: hypothetical protein ACJAWO_001529 [Halieaceae bacterium]|jgi:hypothetical protein